MVLARKWRPQGFEDLIGQGPIVRILANSIEQNKIAHAYIFSGPRGVGKTSTARILAKALNCKEGPTPQPCGKCPSCSSIAQGHSVDVIEIDGASNNSVDDIRDLRERVKYAPSGGKNKVYIIDESHMLSTQAFNALLKTLEEPPSHVVFVLATTEPRKIPLTVMSRCQHLPFKRISTEDIRNRLEQIVENEGISITGPALGMIARAADGSIRDSLTILDQVASFSAEIRDADVKDLLGVADFRGLMNIAAAILDGRREEILGAVADLNERGTDLRAFTKDLIKFFRDLLVARLTKSPEGVVDASSEELADIARLASGVSAEYLSLVIPELIKTESEVRSSFYPRIALEMALIRLSYLSMYRPVSEALAALSGDDRALPPVAAPPETHAQGQAAPEEAEAPSGPEPRGEEAQAPASEPQSSEPQASVPPAESKAPLNAEGLLAELMDRVDPKLSSMLADAVPELSGGSLALTFRSSGAHICAERVKKSLKEITEIASEALGEPVSVELRVKPSRGRRTKKDVKEEAMSEPLVKEALELFDGRVVDVKEIKD
jgi:DNA polymerase-3 subunit gamma/tau